MTPVIDWELLVVSLLTAAVIAALWIGSIVYVLASLSGPNLQ